MCNRILMCWTVTLLTATLAPAQQNPTFRTTEEAIEHLTARIAENPSDVESYAQRAVAWKLKGELDIAIRDYDDAIRLDKDNPRWWKNRGVLYLEKKNYDQAISDFGNAIYLDRKNPENYNDRGKAWLAKRDYDRAIRDCEEAIRLDPRNADGYVGRGNAWRNQKDYASAFRDYNLALQLDPKSPYALGNRALAHARKSQYDLALKDFNQALALHPDSWLYREFAFFLATCPDAKFRDGKKALALAKKATDMALRGQRDGAYLSVLAAAYAEVGDFAEAVVYQQRALEDISLHPDERASYQLRLPLYQNKKTFRDTGP
jgi:tetratricopeptide (TPR) repeat protein